MTQRHFVVLTILILSIAHSAILEPENLGTGSGSAKQRLSTANNELTVLRPLPENGSSSEEETTITVSGSELQEQLSKIVSKNPNVQIAIENAPNRVNPLSGEEEEVFTITIKNYTQEKVVWTSDQAPEESLHNQSTSNQFGPTHSKSDTSVLSSTEEDKGQTNKTLSVSQKSSISLEKTDSGEEKTKELMEYSVCGLFVLILFVIYTL